MFLHIIHMLQHIYGSLLSLQLYIFFAPLATGQKDNKVGSYSRLTVYPYIGSFVRPYSSTLRDILQISQQLMTRLKLGMNFHRG